MMKYIDFRSDSVTWPTEEMRAAMQQALVGDDAFGEDPTTAELESYGASLVGKEAAVFVPSGTFANQIALITHCNRGDEIIIDDRSHIVQFESGGAAALANVQFRTIEPKGNAITVDEITAKIRRGEDETEPKTALICIEDTMLNGNTIPLETMRELRYLSSRYHVPVHLDGARLFNAAAAQNVSAAEIAQNADSVMISLSKGLCAPAGALLCGSKSFIDKARTKRALLGGTMHQSGILAAAGLVALKTMRQRLSQDHETAFYLANSLTQFAELSIDITSVETNMVYCKFNDENFESESLCDFFKSRNILVKLNKQGDGMMLMTHRWINRQDVDTFVKAMEDFLKAN